MKQVQYRRSAQSTGFRPAQASGANISRMREESARVVPCSDDACPFKCENYARDSQFRMVKCDMSPLFGRNKREMPRVNQFAGAHSP